MRIHFRVFKASLHITSTCISYHARSVQPKATKIYDFEITVPHWVYGSSTVFRPSLECRARLSVLPWTALGTSPPATTVNCLAPEGAGRAKGTRCLLESECCPQQDVTMLRRSSKMSVMQGGRVQNSAGADAPKPVFRSEGSPTPSFIEQLGLNSAADSPACGTTLCMAAGKGHQS